MRVNAFFLSKTFQKNQKNGVLKINIDHINNYHITVYIKIYNANKDRLMIFNAIF